MQDITAFYIFDYLPLKIQELLFSQYMDNAMENVFSIASIPTDKQTDLHRDVVGVLIGKYNIEKLAELLKDKYELNESMIKLVMNFLNSKIFNFLKVEMQKAKVIYEQAKKEGVGGINRDVIIQEKISNKPPEKLVSYIQELASSLKERPEEKVAEKAEEEKKEIETVYAKTEGENNPTIEKPPLPKEEVRTESQMPINDSPAIIEKIEEKKGEKDSILLQAMLKNKAVNTGKLNEYYKSLKNNLSAVNTEEKDNVFQPPFKTNTNNRVLIESSFDTSVNTDKSQNGKDSYQEFKTPVKYNSFNYSKKESSTEELNKNDSKFVDLGDFD
jgi:hypothetical protein